nr:hypothetical protein [Tanacetum cinerariifolium]
MILGIFAFFIHLYVPWELGPPVVLEAGDSGSKKRGLGSLVGCTQVLAGVLRVFFVIEVRTCLLAPKPSYHGLGTNLVRVPVVLEDPSEDRSDKPFVLELSDPSSSESSKPKKELFGPNRPVQGVLPMSLFSFLLPQPLGLLPFLVAGQPWFHLLLVQVDWDAGPTDDANVKANLRGTLGLGK